MIKVKEYNFSFIKLILYCVIAFLSVFGLILSITAQNISSYLFFLGICIMIISGIVSVLSIIEKEYNTARAYAFLGLVWLVYSVVQLV